MHAVPGFLGQPVEFRLVLAWDADGLDVLVHFDNDAKVHAPFDAMALIERVSPGAASPR